MEHKHSMSLTENIQCDDQSLNMLLCPGSGIIVGAVKCHSLEEDHSEDSYCKAKQ